MAGPQSSQRTKLLIFVVVATLLASLSPWFWQAPVVLAAQLEPRSLRVSDSQASHANVSYRLQLRVATDGLVGSISLEFCGNSALVGEVCTPPTGFDASSAVLGSQVGVTGFTIATTSTANQIILSRPPAAETAGTTAIYVFTGLTNPSAGPMFARLQTYPTSDASGPATDDGGLALAFNEAVNISAEVPPFLTMCIGETISNFDCSSASEAFSDLGNLDSLVTSAAQHKIVVATNANNGYSMSVNGTTMTSGNNVLPAMTGTASQKGVPQFGMNLRANTAPIIGQDPVGPGSGSPTVDYGQANIFKFTSGDDVASSSGPEDLRKYTVSYIVNVASNQAGGVYATTLTYVCLANF